MGGASLSRSQREHNAYEPTQEMAPAAAATTPASESNQQAARKENMRSVDAVLHVRSGFADCVNGETV